MEPPIPTQRQGLTPTHRLKAPDPQKENVVLFSCGSFSPVHYNHLSMLDLAKRHLTETGTVNVVGGYMAPSGDSFLLKKVQKKHKNGANFIPGVDRCAMVELLLKDSDWIMCDKYESFHDIRAGEAQKHLEKVVQEFYAPYNCGNVRIISVCGVDILSSMRAVNTIKNCLFVVNRHLGANYDPYMIVRSHPARDHIRVVWDDNWKQCVVSSSALRQLWAENKDITHMTSPDIIEYMRQREIKFVAETEPEVSATVAAPTPTCFSDEDLAQVLKKFYQPLMESHQKVLVKLIREEELTGDETVLGFGVSGACYLRNWQGKPVAVKTFVFGNEERNSFKWHMATVAREAILTSGMDHPNVCKLYGCGFGASCVYLVFEYAGTSTKAEPSFAAALKQPQTFFTLLKDIASGMAYAHNEHNVVHRDIQLQNILIHSDGRAMLADWGQAKEQHDSLKVLRGSCRHYAPEALERPKRGSPLYVKASDVFMFGTLMYEAATGRRFWNELETGDAVQKTLAGELPLLPSDLNANFPDDFQRLLLDCLSFKAALRPTADEIVQRLAHMIDQVCKNES